MVVRIKPINNLDTGPFSGEASGLLKADLISHGRSFGLVTSESDARILKALVNLKVASRYQIGQLLGLSANSLKSSMPRLCRLGFVDRLETGKTPPLYMLGPEGRALFNQNSEEWHILKTFRIAAANQLYLMLKDTWPNMEYMVEPHQGLTAQIKAGKIEFGIIAPRLWPGETTWAKDMAELAPDQLRLLIVAGSRHYAEECSRIIKTNRPIRFIWDGVLKSSVRFYKKSGNRLAMAEDFYHSKRKESDLTQHNIVI